MEVGMSAMVMIALAVAAILVLAGAIGLGYLLGRSAN
jgi:hypothetical protein